MSNTTDAGSVPSTLFTIVTPARSAQIPSWSIAAARKVSAAPKTTFLPSALSCAESLPMVVVLPTPFTPITSITDGLVSRCKPSSSPNISVIISFIKPLISLGSVIPCSLTFLRKISQISVAVATPMSDIISISSSSSKSSSSIFVNEFITLFTPFAIESLVFCKPCLILLKKPINSPYYQVISFQVPKH